MMRVLRVVAWPAVLDLESSGRFRFWLEDARQSTLPLTLP